jgi:hypothetical protein
MKSLAVIRSNLWFPIVGVLLCIAGYVIFNTGPVLTALAGTAAAITFFWMKIRHRFFYGLSEILAGIFVLLQNYPQGRGDFSSDFGDGFQTFKWHVVLVSTLAAVYVIVRGFDNIREALRARP